MQYVGYQLLKGWEGRLRPHFGQLITLQIIGLLKVLCCFSYIYYHEKIGTSGILNVVFIALFTANEIYALNYMLSNYDLRRKTQMSKAIMKTLEIKGKIIDVEKAIDIANNESIETWDNSRRCVY